MPETSSDLSPKEQKLLDGLKKGAEAVGGAAAAAANWIYDKWGQMQASQEAAACKEAADDYKYRTRDYRANTVKKLKDKQNSAKEAKEAKEAEEALRFYKIIQERFRNQRAFFFDEAYRTWSDIAQELINKDTSYMGLTSFFKGAVAAIRGKADELDRELEIKKRKIEVVARGEGSYDEKKEMIEYLLKTAKDSMSVFLTSAVREMTGYIKHFQIEMDSLERQGSKRKPLGAFKLVKVYFCLKTAGCDKVVSLNIDDHNGDRRGRGYFEKCLVGEFGSLVRSANKELSKAKKAAEASAAAVAAAAAAAGDVE